MGTVTTQWIVEFVANISSLVDGITESANEAADAVDGIGEAANNANNQIKKLSVEELKASADSIRDLTNQLKDAMQPGVDFEVQLKEMQAATRLTNDEMAALGDSARKTAMEFGNDAAKQLESYGALVARLGPEIAADNIAMEAMGKNIAVLSKSMKGDAVGAMDALTTSMLQFGVDLSHPQEAASEMTRMMNVMAAAGNEGSSEVGDTSAALKHAGLAAKNANVSFEETNSALQALAQGGRLGSEAGVSLHNVLGKMGGLDIIPEKEQEKLRQLGVDYDIVSDKTLPFTTRLRELQKAQGDATLVAQIFGIENEAAANILLQSIDAQEEMTKKISGTNAAMESAEIIMESGAEKASRMQAWVTDLGISFYEATGDVLPFILGLGTVAFTIADIASAAVGISQLIGFIKSLAIGTKLMTAAQWLLNIAMNANPIGLIVAGIVALVSIIYVAIEKYDKFGAVLLLLLGPIGLLINGIMTIKRNWDSITEAFQSEGIIGGIKRIGTVLLDVVLYPIQQLLELLSHIPGLGKYAGMGAEKIAALRKGLDLADPEPSGEGASGEQKTEPQGEGTPPELPPFVGPFQYFQAGGAAGSEQTFFDTKKKGIADKDGVKLSSFGDGDGGGGKTINMTVNNYITGFKSTKEMAEAVAAAINNRLSDGLAIL